MRLRKPLVAVCFLSCVATACGVEGPLTAADVVVRCSESVRGVLEEGWQKRSIIVGPISFVGMAEDPKASPASSFEPRNGRFGGWKQLVFLEEGARAVVSVPKSHRDVVSLLYGERDRTTSPDPTDPTFLVSDGAASVEFVACRSGEPVPAGLTNLAETQFAGGLIVAGARCVSLDVAVSGQMIRRVEVPFGIPSC